MTEDILCPMKFPSGMPFEGCVCEKEKCALYYAGSICSFRAIPELVTALYQGHKGKL